MQENSSLAWFTSFFPPFFLLFLFFLALRLSVNLDGMNVCIRRTFACDKYTYVDLNCEWWIFESRYNQAHMLHFLMLNLYLDRETGELIAFRSSFLRAEDRLVDDRCQFLPFSAFKLRYVVFIEKRGWIMPIKRISLSCSSFFFFFPPLFATKSLETLDKKEGRWG